MRRLHLRFGLGLALFTGVALAVILCVQCVRRYMYVSVILVPQEAEREAERETGALVTAARSAQIMDATELGPLLRQAVESSAGRVIWMRVIDPNSTLLAEAGIPIGSANVPALWWEMSEAHQNLGHAINTLQGKAYVTLVRFRMPHPGPGNNQAGNTGPPAGLWTQGHRNGAYLLEIALSIDAVAGSFHELSQYLFFGILASLALLAAMFVLGLRAPIYLRGKYLEKEMQLARQVQSDLLPKNALLPYIEFAADVVAADHVGGDFYDLFETHAGEISIVLGDVSGKGIPAALLASVVQGSIRSSSASKHETACERINAMLCERTGSGQYVTLFWALFDPLGGTLRYVNAGHAAPVLIKAGAIRSEKLAGGGPVLGLLPSATYSARTVRIDPGDTLLIYSDGISEAENSDEEEFGDDRVMKIGAALGVRTPHEICHGIMAEVSAFSKPLSPRDDRSLLVVRFPRPVAAMTA